MTGASAVILPCGKRLHLQHGPIDLIIGVSDFRHEVFLAATNRFETVLQELVSELPELRQSLRPQTHRPLGAIANMMDEACRPYCPDHFVTRMAAVAGAVADSVLDAMKAVGSLKKAYVNNGGDIALHLDGDETFTTAMASQNGVELGRISLSGDDSISGIATSGRHGRSFSLGVADSVTVLAKSAAKADVAATLIANEVDIANHSLITRVPAYSLDLDSDLGDRLVVTDCKELSMCEQAEAISKGERKAQKLFEEGLIDGAAIFFQNERRLIGSQKLSTSERALNYA